VVTAVAREKWREIHDEFAADSAPLDADVQVSRDTQDLMMLLLINKETKKNGDQRQKNLSRTELHAIPEGLRHMDAPKN
jgi:hypothetical protein